MAKINHLEMGAYVMALNDIEVKKGFLGLSCKLIYKPTNSVIKIKEKEYSAEDGKKLGNILSAAPNDVETAINKFPVSAISMGNVKLEAASRMIISLLPPNSFHSRISVTNQSQRW